MTNLAVAEKETVNQFISTGETAFVTDFPALDSSEVKVSVEQVDKVLGTDYTLSGLGAAGGFTVTFLAATTPGDLVAVWLDMPIKRLTGFSEGASTLFGRDLNTEFVRQVRQDQMLRRDIRRAIRIAPDDPLGFADMELPTDTVRAGKFLTFTAAGAPSVSEGSGGGDTSLRSDLASSAASQGFNLVAVTPNAAEAGLVVNPQWPPGSMIRYGLVPNDSSSAVRLANSARLKALLDPLLAGGPVGRFWFDPIIGSDTYYLAAEIIQVRDGCHLDLRGCTLDIAGAYDAANDTQGFFTMLRDVVIENGAINVDYDGSAGTNNGMGILIGMRLGYAFGDLLTGWSGEENFAEFMGNCRLSNLRLSSTNPALPHVLLLGGLHNVTIENIVVNGNGVGYGFYYEFGEYHYEATVANQTTTHAVNLHFRNIHGFDLSADGLINIVGANNSLVENIKAEDTGSAVVYRNGEALFYNVGAPYVLSGKTRWHVIRNVNAQGCSSNAISLEGAETAANGYLAGEGLTDPQQRDLQGFILQGFNVDNAISFTGEAIIEGGTIRGNAASGGIIVGEDVRHFAIRGVNIFDCDGPGIRAEIANSALMSSRNKRGLIENCVIAGNNGQAILLGLCDGVIVRNNQLGYATAFDGADEATQTSAVNVTADGNGVVCDGNYVKTATGTAYVLAGDGDRGCDIRHTKGERSRSGQWLVDGIAQHNATDIADDGAVINTADKYTGKAVRDTSNNRILYARGAGPTDPWDIADGSAAVTPS